LVQPWRGWSLENIFGNGKTIYKHFRKFCRRISGLSKLILDYWYLSRPCESSAFIFTVVTRTFHCRGLLILSPILQFLITPLQYSRDDQ
jgi:hypothetical protein